MVTVSSPRFDRPPPSPSFYETSAPRGGVDSKPLLGAVGETTPCLARLGALGGGQAFGLTMILIGRM